MVGGPLLGIFTLGMLIESANQTGAVTGLLTSLATMLWVAFGTPRPPLVSLPTSVEGCATDELRFYNATNSVHVPTKKLLRSRDKYVSVLCYICPKILFHGFQFFE